MASPPVISAFQLSRSFKYSSALKPDRFSLIDPAEKLPELAPDDFASTSAIFFNRAGSMACVVSSERTLPEPKPFRSPNMIQPPSPQLRIVSGRSVMKRTASKKARGISGLPLSLRKPFKRPSGFGSMPAKRIKSKPLMSVIIVRTNGSNGERTPAIRSAVGSRKSLTSDPTSIRRSTISTTGLATASP